MAAFVRRSGIALLSGSAPKRGVERDSFVKAPRRQNRNPKLRFTERRYYRYRRCVPTPSILRPYRCPSRALSSLASLFSCRYLALMQSARRSVQLHSGEAPFIFPIACREGTPRPAKPSSPDRSTIVRFGWNFSSQGRRAVDDTKLRWKSGFELPVILNFSQIFASTC